MYWYELLWMLRRVRRRQWVWWYVGEEVYPLTGDEIY